MGTVHINSEDLLALGIERDNLRAELADLKDENERLRGAVAHGKALLVRARGEIEQHRNNFAALKHEYMPEAARRATEKKRRQKLRRRIDKLKAENAQLQSAPPAVSRKYADHCPICGDPLIGDGYTLAREQEEHDAKTTTQS